jgi:hypothetical protein
MSGIRNIARTSRVLCIYDARESKDEEVVIIQQTLH